MKKTRNVFKSYPDLKKIDFSEVQLKYKLFVGGLDPEISALELGHYFNQFGAVIGVKIVGETAGKSRGFGFIVFKDFTSIRRACDQEHKLRERVIDYMPAAESGLEEEVRERRKKNSRSGKKVFVNQLPKTIKKSELNAYFSQFADVIEVLIIIRKKRPCAFAYITFSENANLLKIVTHSHELQPGVVIKAEVAVPKEDKTPQAKPGKKKKSTKNEKEPKQNVTKGSSTSSPDTALFPRGGFNRSEDFKFGAIWKRELQEKRSFGNKPTRSSNRSPVLIAERDQHKPQPKRPYQPSFPFVPTLRSQVIAQERTWKEDFFRELKCRCGKGSTTHGQQQNSKSCFVHHAKDGKNLRFNPMREKSSEKGPSFRPWNNYHLNRYWGEAGGANDQNFTNVPARK